MLGPFQTWCSGADLGEGCRGCPPPPRDDLRFSNTTGILGVEVEQETSAPPPKKNPESAPGVTAVPNSIDRIKFDFITAVAQRLKPNGATAVLHGKPCRATRQ